MKVFGYAAKEPRVRGSKFAPIIKKYSSVMSRLTDVWIPVTAVDEGVAPSVTE